MIVREFTAEDIFDVAYNARERDFQELSSVAWVDGRERVAKDITSRYMIFRQLHPEKTSLQAACDRSGKAFAIFGWVRLRPSTASLVLFATPDFTHFRKGFLRASKAMWRTVLADNDILRVDCQTLEGYQEIHSWLELLGLRREATMPKFGKQGETFVTFAWTRP